MACFPTISNDRPIAWQTKTVNATTALAFLALFACAAVAIAVNQSWITSQLSVSQILVIGLAGGGGFGLISVFFKYCCCCGVETLEAEEEQTGQEESKPVEKKENKVQAWQSLMSNGKADTDEAKRLFTSMTMEERNEVARLRKSMKEGHSSLSPDGGGNIGAIGGSNQNDTFKVNEGQHKGFHRSST